MEKIRSTQGMSGASDFCGEQRSRIGQPLTPFNEERPVPAENQPAEGRDNADDGREETAKDALCRVKRAALAMQRHDWEQGVLAQAFLEDGDTEAAVLLAVEGANRQIADGRCCQAYPGASATDPCAIGEALSFAAGYTGDPALAAARDRLLSWAMTGAPRNTEGIIYHLCGSGEFWVDSFYMLPPFLAKEGCFDEAVRQMNGWWNALSDREAGLLSHRWDDRTRQFIRRDFWGVGNGWAAAGLCRVASLLPEHMAEQKQSLIQKLRILLPAALSFQRPDGMFHDVLDRPDSFPEVNCGQMLAYTIYRGAAAGWAEPDWIEAAERARAAAMCSVDAYGLVRNVCGMPHFDHPGVAPEGQAFFILMEAARRDWIKQQKT